MGRALVAGPRSSLGIHSHPEGKEGELNCMTTNPGDHQSRNGHETKLN